ncbi:MAG: EpsG family protein [Bacteroidales bacterium]|nr:EpsG family protein [Bacteroidales bacterium]
MSLIIYLILVIQVGLRWETGTDWNSYLMHFQSISDFASTSPWRTGEEWGYSIFVWVVKFFSSDYTFFLLVHAIIYYFLIFKSFKHYTSYFFLSLLMFYSITMGMMGSNRQLIAVAICLYALRYIVEEKPTRFFLLVILAMMFHTTAILFIIYYFLNRQIKPMTLFLLLTFSIIIGYSSLPIYLFSHAGNLIGGVAGGKVAIYIELAKYMPQIDKLTLIGLLKRIIFISVFYYNRDKLSEKLPFYTIMLNGYIVGIVIYFLFAHSLTIMVSRGDFYFHIMEPILLASQMLLFNRRENKVIILFVLLVFSFILFFQSISVYPDLFLPYKGIFINTGYSRIMY